MRELRYTLVTNGSSDTALLPILTWLLKMQGVSCAIQAEWADLRQLHLPHDVLQAVSHRNAERTFGLPELHVKRKGNVRP